MKSTQILEKIKTFLGEETSDEVLVELAQAKLENGTVLEAEAFEAGKEIFIVSEDDRVAVPVGEYMMEDGRKLIVKEEGIIGEIKAKEEEEMPQQAEVLRYQNKMKQLYKRSLMISTKDTKRN